MRLLLAFLLLAACARIAPPPETLAGTSWQLVRFQGGDGKVMAGADEAYGYTPFFWSDILDYGYEAVGETRSDLDLVEDWKDGEVGTGVVYYLKAGQVRGVLLWNVWDSVDKARAVIEETGKEPLSDPESLRGRIPLG